MVPLSSTSAVPDPCGDRPAPPTVDSAVAGITLQANPLTFEDSAAMAKPSTVLIKLVSTAGTGYFYTTKKNARSTTEKLNLKKYDPRARKHVEFKEAKIK